MKRAVILVIMIFAISGCIEYEKIEQAKQAAKPAESETKEVVSVPAEKPFESLAKENWDDVASWKTGNDGKSSVELSPVEGKSGTALQATYELKGEYGWVVINRNIAKKISQDIPITFLIKADATSDFEIKFIDKDGSTFFRKMPLRNQYKGWTQIVVYPNNLDYGWGGDDNFDGFDKLEFAFSGKGSGTVILDEIGPGVAGLTASFPIAGPVLDPDRDLKGIGFKERRDPELKPEDPLVLEWLKQVQDTFSPEKQLLPTAEDNQAHTFNNSLVAMAFILKGERERAERILDYYAQSMDKGNRCPAIQNFYYNGEPRGFFQFVILRKEGNLPAYHNPGPSDRWMGDMAWLLTAYKYYEKEYKSDKYKEVTEAIKDLLISWYKDDPGGKGGYVQSGWRKGDTKLHENGGHPEGNIDAYAVFKLCGEDKYAAKIRVWLDSVLKGKSLPLDNYSWRVLAYGKKYAKLLDIPEFDLRYRKTVTFNGKEAIGFFPFPDINVKNAWLDGSGHMVCAYITEGDKERGYFYANQMDAFLIDRNINGVPTKSLPYSANKDGDFRWVRQDIGNISAAAWYIFAKNKFNPLTLEKAP